MVMGEPVATRTTRGASRGRVARARRAGDLAIATSTVLIRLLSVTVQVVTNSPAIRRSILALYQSTRLSYYESVPTRTQRFTVLEHNDGGAASCYVLTCPDGEVRRLHSFQATLAQLEYRINALAAHHLSPYLLVHAGAVAASEAGILLPAASGAGKSTLVAALTVAGFRYLSDDVAVVDTESAAVWPFPKTIRLRRGGWRLITALDDMPISAFDTFRLDGEEVRYVVAPLPSHPYTCFPVRYIFLPEYQAGGPASLKRVPRARMLLELSRHAFNIPRLGTRGIDVLAQLVEEAECYSLTFSDLSHAVSIIGATMGLESTSSPYRLCDGS